MTSRPSSGRSEESSALGFLVDLPIGDRLDVELLVNRQPTEIRFYYDNGDAVPESGPGGLDVTHLHAGLRKRWQMSRLEPFGAFGVIVLTLLASPLLIAAARPLQRER